MKGFALWLTGRGLSCFLQSVAMASLLRSALGTRTTLCMAMIFLWCAQQTTATRFVVGDAAGWTSFDQQLGKAPDYAAWAASHMIYINDTLRQSPFRSSASFLFPNSRLNILTVGLEYGFTSCCHEMRSQCESIMVSKKMGAVKVEEKTIFYWLLSHVSM